MTPDTPGMRSGATDSPVRTFPGHGDYTGVIRTYRCRFCRKLMNGPEAKHGSACPLCGTGRLEVVARVTRRMLEESER